MGPRHDLSFCACKTAWFAPEWHFYMASSPHLCLFFKQNSDFMTRLTSLYKSQTSSVVLSTHNSVLSTRINRLYWFQPSPVVLCMQNSDLRLELQVSVGPRPHLWFLQAKWRLLDQNNKSLWVPGITCRFVHAKQRDLQHNDKSIWVPALFCVFFQAKQRLYDQTYKSVWVPVLICGFEHA